MKFIKLNSYYILDEACELSLKEYKPVKVKTIKRLGGGYYLVYPIEPVVFPVMENGYAIKSFKIHKKYLSPTTIDERIVIRCPLNMPRFNKKDEETLDKIYNRLVQSGNIASIDDINRLKAIVHKIRYIESFNEVNL